MIALFVFFLIYYRQLTLKSVLKIVKWECNGNLKATDNSKSFIQIIVDDILEADFSSKLLY